jgi:hypothetical protein
LLTTAAPAWACNDRTTNWWDWDRCWSPARFSALGGVLVLLGFVCFVVVFPRLLAPASAEVDGAGRTTAPWPKTALGRALALFWLLAVLAFLVFFGVLSDELRRVGRSAATWPEIYWPLLAVAGVAVGGAAFLLWWVRHPTGEVRG